MDVDISRQYNDKILAKPNNPIENTLETGFKISRRYDFLYQAILLYPTIIGDQNNIRFYFTFDLLRLFGCCYFVSGVDFGIEVC
jgi:hypothetical protein